MTARHRVPQGAPRKRVLHWYATVLAVAGVVLIGVASCSSPTPPPQPSADAAGSIDGPGTSLTPSAAPNAGASGDAPSSSAAASSRTSIPTTSAGTPQVPSSASKPTASADATTSAGTTKPSTTKAPSTKASMKASTKIPATAKKSIVIPSFDAPAVKGPILAESKPVSVQIPSLKVDSPTADMSLLPDKTIEVPPLDDTNATGWYDGSPTPGEQGPSVILGHVDSAKNGPSVFYDLGTMKPGDEIDVTRADGSVAVFKVDGVRSYGKNEFPTEVVYGNLDHAGLRLITCGGTFDPNVGHYESNIIAFASLVSSR